MIIFYKEKTVNVIQLNTELNTELKSSQSTDYVEDCFVDYKPKFKVKTKCCEKYKKKAVNCKRCPLLLQEVV